MPSCPHKLPNLQEGILIILGVIFLMMGLHINLVKFQSPSSKCSSCVKSKSTLRLSQLKLPKASSSFIDDSIPKFIHQSARNDTNTWHSTWKDCQNTWIQNFPGWNYKLWHDEDIHHFMKTKYPNFYPILTDYSSNIMIFDIVRYFILYEYGGIYADMDYMVVQNFESVLPIGKACIAESPWKGEGFQNALMASPRRHPFWHYVISEILASKDIDVMSGVKVAKVGDSNSLYMKSVFEQTGPQIIVRAVRAAPASMLHAMRREQFAPENDVLVYSNSSTSALPSIAKGKADPDKIFAAHLGTCSWCK